MPLLLKLFWLGIAGALGAITRFGIIAISPNTAFFALGVLWANLLGCALAGIIWGISQELLLIDETLKLILLVGFLGSLTTFSAIIMETDSLIRQSQWVLAIGYLCLQNLSGLITFFLFSFFTQKTIETFFL